MTIETRKRRNYTEDFKLDAVALVTEQGYKLFDAGRSLGIGDNQIRRWKREFDEAASGARLSTGEREELKQLRMEEVACTRLCVHSPKLMCSSSDLI